MSTLDERRDLENQLIEKALKDDSFRQQLSTDPKGTIEKEFGVQLPADLNIQVLQEKHNQLFLVLPAAPPASADLGVPEVAGAEDCSGWGSAVGCTLECTQCGNNDTSCQPGPTEG